MTGSAGVDYARAVAILTALHHDDHVSAIQLLGEASKPGGLPVLLAMMNIAHSTLVAYAGRSGTTVEALLQTLGAGTTDLGEA